MFRRKAIFHNTLTMTLIGTLIETLMFPFLPCSKKHLGVFAFLHLKQKNGVGIVFLVRFFGRIKNFS
jgi:hypothetical protein